MKLQSGLGIVEIMVAISIIGIAFVALAFSQVHSFRTTADSQKTALAKDIASKKMEEIRGLGYGAYRSCVPASTDTSCVASGQTISNQLGYSLAWTITNQPKNPSDLTKTLPVPENDTNGIPKPALVGVTVTVSWQEGSAAKSYVLSSYLSCADAGDFSSTTVPCPTASIR
jgi:type II secretory pathway pseudopilin PulG